MQVPLPVLHKVGHICFDQDIERQTLTRLLHEGNGQFADDLASCSVAAKHEPRLYTVLLTGQAILNLGNDFIRCRPSKL